MEIKHRYTSDGLSGAWVIQTAAGEAYGTWAVGSWGITENSTGLADSEIDAILDSSDFWPGLPDDNEWYTSEWDGSSLVNQS